MARRLSAGSRLFCFDVVDDDAERLGVELDVRLARRDGERHGALEFAADHAAAAVRFVRLIGWKRYPPEALVSWFVSV